jgi:glycosyltransferase involved in cell wall biosynthesis
MRIAFLSTQTGFWGGEQHLLQLARGLAARGHDVACAVRPDSALAARLRAAGLAVRELPLVDWFEPRGALRLAAWLRRGRFEIVHAHCPRDYYLAAAAAALAGVSAGGAMAARSPAADAAVRCVGTRHLLRPIGAPALKRPFFARLSAMIAVSEAVRRAFLAAGVMDAARVVTVPNGVDTQRVVPERNGLRRRVGLGDDAPVIGYVGRLSPEKGVPTLLEAARRLRPVPGGGASVFVLGDDPRPGGAHGAELRRLAGAPGLAGRVHFFGWVEDAEAAAADFDVQVVCSRAEPFGLATLEGMARGRPVVATAAGGSPEIIRDGVDGLLVPPDDPEALARSLDRLLGDPALRRRLGEAARRRVAADFSLAAMLDRVEAVYERVLAGRPPGDGTG